MANEVDVGGGSGGGSGGEIHLIPKIGKGQKKTSDAGKNSAS